jgi:hypothetical protein
MNCYLISRNCLPCRRERHQAIFYFVRVGSVFAEAEDRLHCLDSLGEEHRLPRVTLSAEKLLPN